MRVVTGFVMPFKFGRNWSRLSDTAGNVIGPLLAYEGIVAFFLEAAFLGVLLFGRKLVPRWAHFVAAVMVAFGTLLSSFWILATNSWMQTPAGYALVDGRFYPENWLDIVFSPSFPYRLAHTVTGFYVTAAFVVLGVGAYTVRRGLFGAEGRVMVMTALTLLGVMVGIGFLMLGIVALGWLLYFRRRLFDTRWYIWTCQFTIPLGFIAVLAGWTTTEEGRQPWTVYGLLRTADSVTPSLTAHDVMVSLLLYVLAYLVIYPTGVLYMLHIVRKGP